VATSPGKLRGRLLRGNQKLRFDYNHTDYPIPCSPIPKMAAQAAAVAACGSRLFIHSSSTFPHAGVHERRFG
jgi:hypothetical protein